MCKIITKILVIYTQTCYIYITIKTNTMKNITFKTIGTSKDIQVCDCCGKEDLSQTIVMENVNDNTLHYFGTTCATKVNGYNKRKTFKVVLDSSQLELVGKINDIKANEFFPIEQKETVLNVLMNKLNTNYLEYIM